MIHHGVSAMGPRNPKGIDGWVEITLPYMENRNEYEVELDPQYRGPMPCWAIWDWLEIAVPDLHDEVDGPVAWWRTAKMFQFFFRDKRTAAKFYLCFGGELLII